MLIGDTVRLKAEFKDFDGEYRSPENVKLKIYDNAKNQIEDDIDVEPYEIGKYRYDYTISNKGVGPIVVEFQGELDSKPILGRITLDRKWV